MTITEKRNTYRRRINRIIGDVQPLVVSENIFKRVFAKQGKRSMQFDYYRYDHARAMVVGICRQTDSDKHNKPESLVNLMDDIFNDAELFTKKWFASAYGQNYKEPAKNTMRAVGEKDFEEKFGCEDFLDPTIVYADMGRLLFETKEIKKFRNKRVAHLDKNRKLKFSVNFNDLTTAISILEELVIKYNFLLNQRDISCLFKHHVK